MIKLRLVSADGSERRVESARDALIIGRAPDCDIVVNQPYVSSRHLQVLRRGQAVAVVDLGSTNGTFVDGRKIKDHVLGAGQRVTLGQGDLVIEVELAAEPGPSSPAADPPRPPPPPAPAPAPAPAPPPRETESRDVRSRILLEELERAQVRGEELKRKLAAAEARAGDAELAEARASDARERCTRLEAELERARSRVVQLELDVDRLARERDAAAQSTTAESALEVLRAENRRLEGRLATAKADLDARARDEAQNVQAKLLSEELERVRTRCDELERKLEATEGRAAAAAQADARIAEARDKCAKLEREKSEVERDLERARGELARAARSDRELAEHAAKVKKLELELEAARKAPAVAPLASEIIFKLQTENADLKRRLASIEAAAPAAGPVAGADAERLARENREMAARLASLAREVERLQTALASRSTPPPPAPARPAYAESAAPGAVSSVGALLRALIDDDVGDRPALYDGPVDDFLVLEQFRFLRHVERVITRVAGDFIHLYQAHTVLPDVEGNFRGLAGAVCSAPQATDARQELVRYIEELEKWLVVALAAHRSAAVRFAEQIKGELTEKALTEKSPIPAFKRLSGGVEGELWRRASSHLRELSPDMLDDRLEKLAREVARELLESQQRPA